MDNNGNVIDHPHRNVRRLHAVRLKDAFIARGKGQADAFARLSCTLETLSEEAKLRFGPRSGAMQRAFGDELIKMKGRFTARNGVPPAQIYQTPDAWLRVFYGFAQVLGRDPDSVLISALEDAAMRGNNVAQANISDWMDELQSVTEQMMDHLRGTGDLAEVAQYIARSGLMLSDGTLDVSEWPSDHLGYSDNEIFNASILGLIPHVFGLHYVPVTSEIVEMHPDREEVTNDIPELRNLDAAVLANATDFCFNEGVRTGVAVVLHAPSQQFEFALVEWHHADVTLEGAAGDVLAVVKTEANLHALMGGERERGYWPGTPNSSDIFRKTDHWIPNTVRFNFFGSAGFEKRASSVIVRPWIWNDPIEQRFWEPDPQDAENCPVASPRHSVAAVIEGNLLYADAEGQAKGRLDRLLVTEIERVCTLVNSFRAGHESRRLAHRAILLAQWNNPAPTPR